MLLCLEKKQLFKIKCLIVLFCLVLTSSCARPIGNSWTGVSSGSMPAAPISSVDHQVNFGERSPADHLSSGDDVGASFSSSLPSGYPQPMEKFLPENVFSDADLSDHNAQMASMAYGIPPEQEVEQFENVESFVDPVEDWLVQEGATLKQILGDWSDRAGWRLVWKSRRDFKIEAGAMLRGRYIDVSSAIIRNLARATPAPLATFFRGNRVLLVETLEDENAY